jgi:hypothetical protein
LFPRPYLEKPITKKRKRKKKNPSQKKADGMAEFKSRYCK